MHNPITYACTLLALAHSTLASPNTLFPRANDTSPPNQTCQAARSQVQTVCDDINLLSYELQSIQLCPPAGNETHYADLIRQALQTILGYERQQNDTSLIAAEERAATALLGLFNVTVTDQDAILPLLVGAAEAVYPDVCAVAVEVGVLEGYCTEATARYHADDSCDGQTVPLKSRSQDLAPRQDALPSENVCQLALDILPSFISCTEIGGPIDCATEFTNLTKSYFTPEESQTFENVCQDLNIAQVALGTLCGLRGIIADFLPFCDADNGITTSTEYVTVTSIFSTEFGSTSTSSGVSSVSTSSGAYSSSTSSVSSTVSSNLLEPSRSWVVQGAKESKGVKECKARHRKEI